LADAKISCGSRAVAAKAENAYSRNGKIRPDTGFIKMFSKSRTISVFQLPFQYFAHQRGVGLAFGKLHHLALSEFSAATLAAL